MEAQTPKPSHDGVRRSSLHRLQRQASQISSSSQTSNRSNRSRMSGFFQVYQQEPVVLLRGTAHQRIPSGRVQLSEILQLALDILLEGNEDDGNVVHDRDHNSF